MKSALKEAADDVLRDAVAGNGLPGVPGVIAMATDRTENIYEGAAGKRSLAGADAMTLDTVVGLWSCTKAITGVALMQLVEEGKIALDDLAKKYVPDIAAIAVLDGFDSSGEPVLRPPKSDITLRQLMLHTAGFGYDFFNYDLLKFSRRCVRCCCSIPARAGNTGPTSIGSVESWNPYEANGSVR